MHVLGRLRKESYTQNSQTVKGKVIFKPLPLLDLFFLTTVLDVWGGDAKVTNPLSQTLLGTFQSTAALD